MSIEQPRQPSQQPVDSARSRKIDLLISLCLHSWPALTYAIQNAWGGSPQISQDKRDWLAGSISDLVSTEQITHADDLEEVLAQVMLDEFEVVIDDDSALETAQKIWKGREKILEGDFKEVDQMYATWKVKGNPRVKMQKIDENENGQDTDRDEDDEEWNGFQDDDEEMEEAPPLVEKVKREKAEPIIDKDGFTTVTSKRR